MSGDDEERTDTGLLGELSELGSAIVPLLRRLLGVKTVVQGLTGGLTKAGANALKSRMELYRTGNLVKEAQLVADTSGLPLPQVFDSLARQRNLDELTMEALRRVSEKVGEQSVSALEGEGGGNSDISARWLRTFSYEAGKIDSDEDEFRERFVRILAGEMEVPGTFSLSALQTIGAMSTATAEHFRRAVSASIRLTPDGKLVMDARIPAVGGSLGQNCLLKDGLSFDVLLDLTENGLVHPDYGCHHPYGPLTRNLDGPNSDRWASQIPFMHRDAMWELKPQADPGKTGPMKVEGAKITSCGVELLKIVDIELLPDFTDKLIKHFSGAGYRMVRSSQQSEKSR